MDEVYTLQCIQYARFVNTDLIWARLPDGYGATLRVSKYGVPEGACQAAT